MQPSARCSDRPPAGVVGSHHGGCPMEAGGGHEDTRSLLAAGGTQDSGEGKVILMAGMRQIRERLRRDRMIARRRRRTVTLIIVGVLLMAAGVYLLSLVGSGR